MMHGLRVKPQRLKLRIYQKSTPPSWSWYSCGVTITMSDDDMQTCSSKNARVIREEWVHAVSMSEDERIWENKPPRENREPIREPIHNLVFLVRLFHFIISLTWLLDYRARFISEKIIKIGKVNLKLIQFYFCWIWITDIADNTGFLQMQLSQ